MITVSLLLQWLTPSEVISGQVNLAQPQLYEMSKFLRYIIISLNLHGLPPRPHLVSENVVINFTECNNSDGGGI